MQEKINRYQNYNNSIIKQKDIIYEQFKLSQNQYKRDSLLNRKGVISVEELELSKNQHLQSYLSLENMHSEIKNTEIQITQMKENLLDIEYQYSDKKNTLESQLKTYTSQLISEIQAWEQAYTLISPIDGQVSFTNYWTENQNVVIGETVFTIIPNGNEQLIGKAQMPQVRSGKVKIGHRVNIRFSNFPDNEYGIVRGFVKNISMVPTKNIEGVNSNYYVVEIELPDKLMTSYNKELPYLPEMEAHADIITEDISLLERLFMPVRKILTENI